MSARELVTARTRLRPFSTPDEDELLVVFRDPGVRRYLLDDQLVSLDWVRDEIAASDARFSRAGTGLWSVRLAGPPAIVGFVGFRDFFEPPQLQLLYGLLPHYWGQGLATEVAARLCDHGFRDLGLSQIRAAIDTPNEASRAVLLRLGMTEVSRSEEGATSFFARRVPSPG